MSRSYFPAVPDAAPIDAVLRRSGPLALLRERLRDSEARFAAIVACLPALMAPHVRAGPVDANGWTLLVENTAVAAKLRQFEPRLQEALRRGGWAASPIRIKVNARQGG